MLRGLSSSRPSSPIVVNKMRFAVQAVAGALLLAIPLFAKAESPSAPRFVLACAPCHGFDAIGYDDSTPNLAGQHRQYLRQYLYNQLMAFRTGRRSHPPMDFFSGQMSGDELQAITQYYSALPSH